MDDVKLKLEFDLRYLRNRSFYQDVRILWRTIAVVISGAGAH